MANLIIGGDVIKTDENGLDVSYPELNNDLIPESLYIRLDTSNNEHIYIPAFEIDTVLARLDNITKNKADIDVVSALEIALNSKASAIQLSTLENDIISKADKTSVTELADTVNTKADKTSVTELADTVNTKADKTSVDKLKEDVEALESALGSISDSATITAIKNQILYLNDEINRRLTIDDLQSFTGITDGLSGTITANTERIETLENTMGAKASIAYVQKQRRELDEVLSGVVTQITGKASKAEVASKASQDDLTVLINRINSINTSTSEGIEELKECCKLLQDELNKKATKSSLESLITTVNTALATKADKSYINDSITQLNSKIDNIDIDTPISDISEDIHNMEVGFNNTISGISSTINTHNQKIYQQELQISQLQESNSKLEIATANEWVRVMTPEEYNKLSNDPNYSDGTKNPYAKQPNVLYMLVRYNKPIAVYIGTVLIAEAKQDGSVGFAYEFPIIF